MTRAYLETILTRFRPGVGPDAGNSAAINGATMELPGRPAIRLADVIVTHVVLATCMFLVIHYLNNKSQTKQNV